LIAREVHEEAVGQVHEDRGARHVDHDAERRQPRQHAEHQRDRAEELNRDHQVDDRRGQPHVAGQHADGPGNPRATEKAERFLRAVRPHHDRECQAQDEEGDVGRPHALILRRTAPRRNHSVTASARS
jgi:hypothetical protein